MLVSAAALALPVLHLAAQARAAPAPVEARREQAQRFLEKRGVLVHASARQLAEARSARPGSRLSAAAKPAYGPALLSQPWQSLGPAQISTSAFGEVTGRVTGIAADPSDATGNTVYLGTTGGGVWKSINAAGSASSAVFTPLTDTLPIFTSGNTASLSIGAVSVQPGGTGVVLAGTGDPNDALDSYYGTGILRSTDGGVTWSLIPESSDFSVNSLTNFYFFGLASAGFAWSATNTNLVVAAISQSADGLLVNAIDTESEPADSLSVKGLYYSEDAGATWKLATITDGPGQVVQSSLVIVGGGGNAATAVVWNPVRQRFYAAVRFHGYYESLDGITWTRLAHQPGTGLTTTECPTNPNDTGSPACPILRGALAAQPVSGDLFALTVDANLLDQGLWKDACSRAAGGACASNSVTFSQRVPSVTLEDVDGSGVIDAGDYSLTLAAVPVAGDTLLFAGTTDIYRCSLSSGCSFRNTTNSLGCAAAGVAPFAHAIDTTFAGTRSLMYFGNDSGLWRSTDDVNQLQSPCKPDDANHFQNLNGGLGSLAEIQNMAQDPADSNILLAGAGGNGDAAMTTAGQTLWPQVLDGYGSYVAIDQNNSQNWYAQSASGVAIDFCGKGSSCALTDFIANQVIGSAQVGSDAFAFAEPAPFLLDPRNSANIIVGTCHVWRGPADGSSWSTAANLLGDLYPGEGPDCYGNALVQSLAAAVVSTPAGNTGILYAGTAGLGIAGPQAYAGHLYTASVSDVAPIPASWTDLRPSPVTNEGNGFNPQDFSISSIAADPHDASGGTVYVTIQGFSTPTGSTGTVYASSNGGASWTNITSNLPLAPANSIVIDPNDANTVYVALDTGVYITTTVSTCGTENCWSVYGTGLPNSPVVQLATFNSGGQSLLRAATYGRGIWQVPLVTAAATFTTVTVAPVSLVFAAQQVQSQSPAQTLTLTNTGTIPMMLNQIGPGGDFAYQNDCASPVPVGGSCTISVTFTPTATGARSATLTVYLNVSGGQVTIPLSGTGIPGGAIVLAPTSLSFPVSPNPYPLIGQTTAPQNVTISNTGGVSVNLQLPTVTGDFAIVANTCSASLASNYGCTVSVAFTPTVAGQRSGVFSITDDVGTQTATLSGIGLAPATDTISPTALSFPATVVGTASTPQAVTLSNSGGSPLTSISVSVTGDFQAVNACGNSLVGHAGCSIAVTYVPTTAGTEVGDLTINDMYGHSQTVLLSGTGVAPAGVSALPRAINFGPWAVAGTSPAQAVTITNNGGVALGSLKLTTSGDFATTGATGCPIGSSSQTLAPGASCSVQVVFSPGQSGARAGSLTIGDSAATTPFQVALSGNGFGFTLAPQGSSSVTVAAGQTASYMLQVTPSAGSIGPLTIACGSLPENSTCTANPASMELTTGATASIAVTIATVAQTSASADQRSGAALLAACLPLSFFVLAPFRIRRRGLQGAALLLLCLTTLSCGVTSTGGASGGTSSSASSTPSATYNPVITATGAGVTQSVTLTLIVD